MSMSSPTKQSKIITLSIIGSVGVPAKYGGWETLVENLIEFLNKDFRIIVFCSSKSYDNKLFYYKGVELRYINLKANGIQSIFYDAISLYYSNKFANYTLILGVSGAIFFPFLKKSNNKIIINPDGLEWKRSKWNFLIKKFLKLSELIALRYSDIIVSDNIEIKNYILKEYSLNSSFIAYGSDHVKKVKITTNDIENYKFLNKKYAFKVCRIEPENNISIILESFSINNLLLVIVGNWNHSDFAINLRKKYSKFKNIFLLDSIFNQNDLDLLRSNCYIYIHGHSAGGTNPSLIEAMRLALPVVAFNSSFNVSTTKSSAIYFSNIEELNKILSSLNNINLSEIASNLFKIANANYNWIQISERYKNLIIKDKKP